MPKIYVRVNPRSQISKRHRCSMGFTDVWKEIDVDDATRAALEEDPYLEVSETPTVLVEVAAAVQTAAVETVQAPNNTPESTATDEGSTGEIAAEGTDTGTASPVANEADAGNDQPIETGEAAPAVDAADAVADGTAANSDGEQQANGEEKTEAEPRIDAIKAAIGQLDSNNAEYWLKDGRPSTAALETVGGLLVTAAERDSVWASLNKGAE